MKQSLIIACLSSFVLISTLAFAQKTPEREYYKLIVYHYKDAVQEDILDTYLEHALLPALHRQKVSDVGVFKSLSNDTVTDKLLYVFMPFKSLKDMKNMEEDIDKDKAYQAAGSNYIDAAYNKPPYTRKETIILYAFPMAPKMQLPQLKSAANERVYELRSYESATEKVFANKVRMFNEGGEVPLFKRLNFNAVFYSEVIAGPKMPNLMYMTTFENMQDREAHWKAFGADEEWKKLSSMPEYQNNVQHIDITFLRPTNYSDF
ncbi:NIPSNAP family containing protein [Panacibacter ginsenosidivorans]|uniref:NIPSNAP family containing protein n=1 Tax=Panacibacter ginsenosidivorans TaxID=1813871 RepID=A0A5B8VEP4_9BACT|nr:NIPSNAP family protein [Panacibacter ginsenosidivorans]QEC69769.1 NIPSNAP family containing protein [Panacibacter ginsenosidivorans]